MRIQQKQGKVDHLNSYLLDQNFDKDVKNSPQRENGTQSQIITKKKKLRVIQHRKFDKMKSRPDFKDEIFAKPLPKNNDYQQKHQPPTFRQKKLKLKRFENQYIEDQNIFASSNLPSLHQSLINNQGNYQQIKKIQLNRILLPEVQYKKQHAEVQYKKQHAPRSKRRYQSIQNKQALPHDEHEISSKPKKQTSPEQRNLQYNKPDSQRKFTKPPKIIYNLVKPQKSIQGIHRKMIKQKTPKKGRYVQVRQKIQQPGMGYYKQPIYNKEDYYQKWDRRLEDSFEQIDQQDVNMASDKLNKRKKSYVRNNERYIKPSEDYQFNYDQYDFNENEDF